MAKEKYTSGQQPKRGATIPSDIATNPVAQGLSVALFAAAQDNCTCRTCQILRKVLNQMTTEYLKGGE